MFLFPPKPENHDPDHPDGHSDMHPNAVVSREISGPGPKGYHACKYYKIDNTCTYFLCFHKPILLSMMQQIYPSTLGERKRKSAKEVTVAMKRDKLAGRVPKGGQ